MASAFFVCGHLAAIVDACEQPYLNFGPEGGRFITLDRHQVRADCKRCADKGWKNVPARTECYGVDLCQQPYFHFGLEGGRFITLDRQQVRGNYLCQ
jgi:hypothetical protein